MVECPGGGLNPREAHGSLRPNPGSRCETHFSATGQWTMTSLAVGSCTWSKSIRRRTSLWAATTLLPPWSAAHHNLDSHKLPHLWSREVP